MTHRVIWKDPEMQRVNKLWWGVSLFCKYHFEAVNILHFLFLDVLSHCISKEGGVLKRHLEC